MTEKSKPDLNTFMSDPKFQADRDLLEGFLQKTLEKRAASAAEKIKKNEKPADVFDTLFGVTGTAPAPAKNGDFLSDVLGF